MLDGLAKTIEQNSDSEPSPRECSVAETRSQQDHRGILPLAAAVLARRTDVRRVNRVHGLHWQRPSSVA